MSKLPDLPVTLRIYSKPAELQIVRATVEKMCQMLGFSGECCGGIVLAVDEALTNIIRHAYNGAADKPIEISLLPVGDPPQELRICLRDFGEFVDPARIKSRDLGDVRPGGLGVHIISNCMDSVEYSRAPGGGTLLTLVKRIAGKRGAKE